MRFGPGATFCLLALLSALAGPARAMRYPLDDEVDWVATERLSKGAYVEFSVDFVAGSPTKVVLFDPAHHSVTSEAGLTAADADQVWRSRANSMQGRFDVPADREYGVFVTSSADGKQMPVSGSVTFHNAHGMLRAEDEELLTLAPLAAAVAGVGTAAYAFAARRADAALAAHALTTVFWAVFAAAVAEENRSGDADSPAMLVAHVLGAAAAAAVLNAVAARAPAGPPRHRAAAVAWLAAMAALFSEPWLLAVVAVAGPVWWVGRHVRCGRAWKCLVWAVALAAVGPFTLLGPHVVLLAPYVALVGASFSSSSKGDSGPAYSAVAVADDDDGDIELAGTTGEEEEEKEKEKEDGEEEDDGLLTGEPALAGAGDEEFGGEPADWPTVHLALGVAGLLLAVSLQPAVLGVLAALQCLWHVRVGLANGAGADIAFVADGLVLVGQLVALLADGSGAVSAIKALAVDGAFETVGALEAALLSAALFAASSSTPKSKSS